MPTLDNTTATATAVARTLTPAQQYRAASHADNTVAAYGSDLAIVTDWLAANDRATTLPMAADDVADFLAAHADDGYATATVTRRAAAIASIHRHAGHPSPCDEAIVTRTLRGIRRTHGTAPNRAIPLLTRHIVAMLDATPPTTPLGLRNRAILLLGFATGARVSELIALTVADVDFNPPTGDGIVVTITRSKTDQTGAGRTIGVARGTNPATDPVAALSDWLYAAAITTGHLFRSTKVADLPPPDRALHTGTVAHAITMMARAAGLDDAEAFTPHSLRAGHATVAAANGARDRTIMATTGHASHATLDGYVRAGRVLDDPSSARLGL